MSIQISMYVDKAVIKGSGPQEVNCVATITNLSSSAVTVTSVSKINSPAGSTASRAQPTGPTGPLGVVTIPGLGTAAYVWSESFIANSPPPAGAPCIQAGVGMAAQVSDGSTASSPIATINIYSSQPPAAVASVNGASINFSPPPGGNTPQLPQLGMADFEATQNSGQAGAIVGH